MKTEMSDVEAKCLNCLHPMQAVDAAACRDCFAGLIVYLEAQDRELSRLRALMPDDERLVGKTLTECVAIMAATFIGEPAPSAQEVEVRFFKQHGRYWRIVPADPTQEMLQAWKGAATHEEAYDAMLKAAPPYAVALTEPA